MIKSWVFEFLHAPQSGDAALNPHTIARTFDHAFAIWRRVEELGFEGIFFSEHHFSLSYSPSPNLLVAAAAQHTKRLRLGVMGVVLPFYEPWRVAEELCMLDHLTGGRLEIGYAGGVPQELSRVGIEAVEGRERYTEALEIIEKALVHPAFSHDGKHWRFENLTPLPRPLQQPLPPRWTTLVSEASAIGAAKRGTKICTGFESVQRIKQIFDAYRNACDDLGRTHSADDLAVRRNVLIGSSEQEAKEMADISREAARKVMAGDTRVGKAPAGLLDAPKAGAGFSVHADEFIAGTPQQVAEQIIEQMRGCGAGNFLGTMGRGLGERRAEIIEAFGAHVVPVLKKA